MSSWTALADLPSGKGQIDVIVDSSGRPAQWEGTDRCHSGQLWQTCPVGRDRWMSSWTALADLPSGKGQIDVIVDSSGIACIEICLTWR